MDLSDPLGDDALLADLRRVVGLVDPVPFWHFEICRLVPMSAPALAGVRGDEETRRATFESASLTIMLEWSEAADDTVRLDGWLAPPGPFRVEIRTVDGPQTVDADEGGRFAAPRVTRGSVQLRVQPPDEQAVAFRTVVTPSFVV
ncbi:hypothetical protein [Dactylosporangium fulvum]|uniref:Uncharacterized protein n=1 Tax=Dactylosporangium fulvum TaxID=53359 RepID=A0ABY5W1I0_9ACTN|nr:hypothetical protein [Dactylosporangium fulvum]UWP82904.1 hypothetical protein Dfulv_00900 [Dactylosporangium fulvum]